MQYQEGSTAGQRKVMLSIAPMIDISNTHFRYFCRLLSKTALLYTEMLHHDAVIHSHQHLLPFNREEHPVVLQLGGSDPDKLAEAALLGQRYGYDAINLNVGCPSPRVQKGSFGACLMKEPALVRECLVTMAKAVKIPCTIKCRLGVDQFDSYEFVRDFVSEVSDQGQGPITHFAIHARKALLKGLNPAQNRSVPPLMYDRVYRLKKDFPQLTFEINGGIKDLAIGHQICIENGLDGCMVGRLANQNPFELIKADHIFAQAPNHLLTGTDKEARDRVMLQYADYIEKLENGLIADEWGHSIRCPNPSVLVKPIINLYNGEPGCGKYRQFLSDLAKLKEKPLHLVIREAARLMRENVFVTPHMRHHHLHEEKKEDEKQQKKEEKESDPKQKEEKEQKEDGTETGEEVKLSQ